eukprot:TRINITY_DN29519_c0_g1_i1.p1 TRINITY_DN29519_c0_g1~~TRINITY_DN29519_c0_g1_i1.p1  ORF type:complete len:992 (+),score=113.50 TRINITY_DN29519_c0_g1_i1:87-2978(+)
MQASRRPCRLLQATLLFAAVMRSPHPTAGTPTAAPSGVPSTAPSSAPAGPSMPPSEQPSAAPTESPSGTPNAPGPGPSAAPAAPVNIGTNLTNATPTQAPATAAPSGSPCVSCTPAPTTDPTESPQLPSAAPSPMPTSPTRSPTFYPTTPTVAPSRGPRPSITDRPTALPTEQPTMSPEPRAGKGLDDIVTLAHVERYLAKDQWPETTAKRITCASRTCDLCEELGAWIPPNQQEKPACRWRTLHDIQCDNFKLNVRANVQMGAGPTTPVNDPQARPLVAYCIASVLQLSKTRVDVRPVVQDKLQAPRADITLQFTIVNPRLPMLQCLRAMPRTTKFAELAEAAQLDLDERTDWTVFAFSNEHYARLSVGTRDLLEHGGQTRGPSALQRVMSAHVVNGSRTFPTFGFSMGPTRSPGGPPTISPTRAGATNHPTGYRGATASPSDSPTCMPQANVVACLDTLARSRIGLLRAHRYPVAEQFSCDRESPQNIREECRLEARVLSHRDSERFYSYDLPEVPTAVPSRAPVRSRTTAVPSTAPTVAPSAPTASPEAAAPGANANDTRVLDDDFGTVDLLNQFSCANGVVHVIDQILWPPATKEFVNSKATVLSKLNEHNPGPGSFFRELVDILHRRNSATQAPSTAAPSTNLTPTRTATMPAEETLPVEEIQPSPVFDLAGAMQQHDYSLTCFIPSNDALGRTMELANSSWLPLTWQVFIKELLDPQDTRRNESLASEMLAFHCVKQFVWLKKHPYQTGGTTWPVTSAPSLVPGRPPLFITTVGFGQPDPRPRDPEPDPDHYTPFVESGTLVGARGNDAEVYAEPGCSDREPGMEGNVLPVPKGVGEQNTRCSNIACSNGAIHIVDRILVADWMMPYFRKPQDVTPAPPPPPKSDQSFLKQRWYIVVIGGLLVIAVVAFIVKRQTAHKKTAISFRDWDNKLLKEEAEKKEKSKEMSPRQGGAGKARL